MNITYQNIISGIVTLLGVTMFFSCEGNLKEVRSFGMEGDAPQGVAEGINLKFTDSGRLVATLVSPRMVDFRNKEFPYQEFPDGVEVVFFDEKNDKNTVIADYAIVYEQTNLIDLQGNVRIVTADSAVLKGDQMYWDQNLNWIFTDKSNIINFPNGDVNRGEGFDSNQNFGNFRSRTNTGVKYIEEESQEVTDSTQQDNNA